MSVDTRVYRHYLFSVASHAVTVILGPAEMLGLRVLHVGPDGHGQAERRQEYGLQKVCVMFECCLLFIYQDKDLTKKIRASLTSYESERRLYAASSARQRKGDLC